MRSNLLIPAVLCLSVAARAADGGPAEAVKAPAIDAGQAIDVSQELNKSMGAMQAAQSAMRQASSTLEAEFKQWMAGKAADAGADKKFAKLKIAEEALITKHSVVLKKHAELVAKLETLAREHAEKKTDDKKAKASQAKLVKEQQRLATEHQALVAEHTKRLGISPAADAGAAVDAGRTDGGSSGPGVLGAGADAGSTDGGGTGAGGVDAAVADAGTAIATTVDAGAPAEPPKYDGCSAAGGALGLTLISTLALLRRSRRRPA